MRLRLLVPRALTRRRIGTAPGPASLLLPGTWRSLATLGGHDNDERSRQRLEDQRAVQFRAKLAADVVQRARQRVRGDVQRARARVRDDVLRAKEVVREDVERARELVHKDVERAKELALHQVINVPNAITMARIVATPYLGYLIYDGAYATAVGVMAVAGLSDWLDGFIARRFKQESIIGSFLDPFADKFMVGTLSLSMLASGLLPWPLVVLVFGRDALLVSGTFYHRLKTKAASSAFFDTSDSGAFQVAPSLLSKVNTALQFSMFGLALTNAAWQLPGDSSLEVLFGVVGTTTFLSGSEYLWSYVNKTGAFRPLPAQSPSTATTTAKSNSKTR